MENSQLAKFIDLTLLKPEASPAQIDALCAQALELGVYAVCVNPVHVARVANVLRGSGVPPISVVGFPLGANISHIKAVEATLAISHGAREIDMVVDIGALRTDDEEKVTRDIREVASACRSYSVPLKVILETSVLNTGQIMMGCRAAENAGAQFVKTSTGFHPTGGATIAAIQIMHNTVGGRLGIKASGGIRDRATALAMIAAGATRIGASDARAILAETPNA